MCDPGCPFGLQTKQRLPLQTHKGLLPHTLIHRGCDAPLRGVEAELPMTAEWLTSNLEARPTSIEVA